MAHKIYKTMGSRTNLKLLCVAFPSDAIKEKAVFFVSSVCNVSMSNTSFIFMTDSNDRKCQCGYYLSDHRDPESALKNGMLHGQGEWNHKTHTSPIPTNAFGEIEFVGYGDKVAKVGVCVCV